MVWLLWSGCGGVVVVVELWVRGGVVVWWSMYGSVSIDVACFGIDDSGFVVGNRGLCTVGDVVMVREVSSGDCNR